MCCCRGRDGVHRVTGVTRFERQYLERIGPKHPLLGGEAGFAPVRVDLGRVFVAPDAELGDGSPNAVGHGFGLPAIDQ